jgi:hypothetical protein
MIQTDINFRYLNNQNFSLKDQPKIKLKRRKSADSKLFKNNLFNLEIKYSIPFLNHKSIENEMSRSDFESILAKDLHI